MDIFLADIGGDHQTQQRAVSQLKFYIFTDFQQALFMMDDHVVAGRAQNGDFLIARQAISWIYILTANCENGSIHLPFG